MRGIEQNPRRVWDTIYGVSKGNEGSGQTYLNLFSGFRPPKKDGKPKEPNKNKLQGVTDKYFSWPEEADQATQWAQQESQNGREVYQCSHLLTDKRRVKENAVPPSALYADGDGAKIPDWMPPPSVVVESSPDREQYYWTVTKPMTSEEFEDVNKRLTYALGADKGKWALATLLRAPGTKNYKYENTPTVRVERLEGEEYGPEHLDRVLRSKSSTEEEPEESSKGTKDREYKEEYGYNDEEPPVRLNDYGMKVWHGEQVKLKDDGQVDTSASLLLLGRVLYNGGATRSTIVKALKERDESLGWKKYTNRKDAEKQYQQIVNTLKRDDRDKNTHTSDSDQKRNNTFGIGQRVLLGEAIQRVIESPEELVEDILLKGKVHQIFAAPGLGKSWLALWLTMRLINQGKLVLYLNTENGPNIIAERLQALGADPEKLDKCLNYIPSPNLPITAEGSEAYMSLLEEVKPALVVFDSWVNFLSGAELDENVSSDIARWSVNFVRPARDREITVLLLDHVPKEKVNARGSGRKKEEMDVQWQLKSENFFDRNTIGEIKLIREKDREGWLPKSVKLEASPIGHGLREVRPSQR